MHLAIICEIEINIYIFVVV